MSRIIVKNIPTKIEQSQLIKHFSKIGTVTDCKVIKNQTGKSRRFCFIGFKDNQSAEKAMKQYNNTYIGVSKVVINHATTKSVQKIGKKQKSKDKIKKQQEQSKRFNQFKKIVQQRNKKSWDDLVTPLVTEQLKKNTKNKKMDKKEQEKQQIVKVREKSNEKHAESTNMKAIRAPVISEKNKKFINKPLNLDQSRLYVTNIPYDLNQQQLIKPFKKYGTLSKVKLPKQYDNKNKGYAFITYTLAEQAMRAFHQLNNKIVFGRIIHVTPSLQDIGQIIRNGKEAQYQKLKQQKYGNSLEEKTSYKKNKKKEMRNKLNDTTNWNTLFLNPNTVLESISKKLGITKSDILLSQNLAPKIALAEAQIIDQTKKWMQQKGLNLNFLQIDRSVCQRSKKILLLKNLNYRTLQADIRQLFNFYGTVNKLLLAPNRSIGIVQFQNQQYARNAFQKLQYYKFKNNFLYLEYAPIGILEQQQISKIEKEQAQQQAVQEELSKVVYMKNLSFDTSEQMLEKTFEKFNEQIRSLKIIYNKNEKSMGYGFIEFNTNQSAINFIKKMNNTLVDGHKILMSISHPKKNPKEQQANKKPQEQPNNKLMVRNIAFQATKDDIRELFKEFGTIKKIRIPKKMNGEHRGFGFVEFQSIQEAQFAKQSLGNSHLYGRKLVIQFQKASLD